MPKISVIIPTIGRETLKEAIKSVLNQTFKDFEIIVSDDTEEEKARKIVKSFLGDPRIKYVVNRKYKHGPAGNKNNGLDHITGEYFTFLDDDDVLFENALEDLINIAQKKQYQIVFANCIDDVKGEFTGKHYGKSEEVTFQDILSGKFDGEYFGIVYSPLLGKERFIEECWGGEAILWWKLWKKAKRGYYLHKAVRLYRTLLEDRVSKQSIDFDKAERTFLNYKYTLDIFQQDFKLLCSKNYVKLALMGIYFANLAGKRKEILRIIKNAFSTRFSFAILLIPWALTCLFLPRKFIRFFYEKIIRNTGLNKKLKRILLGY